MAQGNEHGANFSDFGDDQRAGVLHVVGVAHMEKITAAVKVTNGGGVFRTRSGFGASAAGASQFALGVHFDIPFSLLQCIVNKLKQLKNMAKVIEICSMKFVCLPSLVSPLSNALA